MALRSTIAILCCFFLVLDEGRCAKLVSSEFTQDSTEDLSRLLICAENPESLEQPELLVTGVLRIADCNDAIKLATSTSGIQEKDILSTYSGCNGSGMTDSMGHYLFATTRPDKWKHNSNPTIQFRVHVPWLDEAVVASLNLGDYQDQQSNALQPGKSIQKSAKSPPKIDEIQFDIVFGKKEVCQNNQGAATIKYLHSLRTRPGPSMVNVSGKRSKRSTEVRKSYGKGHRRTSRSSLWTLLQNQESNTWKKKRLTKRFSWDDLKRASAHYDSNVFNSRKGKPWESFSVFIKRSPATELIRKNSIPLDLNSLNAQDWQRENSKVNNLALAGAHLSGEGNGNKISLEEFLTPIHENKVWRDDEKHSSSRMMKKNWAAKLKRERVVTRPNIRSATLDRHMERQSPKRQTRLQKMWGDIEWMKRGIDSVY